MKHSLFTIKSCTKTTHHLIVPYFCFTLHKKTDMDHLPLNDTPMLVSAINFLLRDEEFDTLDEICFHFNINRDELEQKLANEGFQYSEQHKRVI